MLTTEAEIRAALAMMNPVGQTATQTLVEHLAANHGILNDDYAFDQNVIRHCLAAMGTHGWDPHDQPRIDRWMEDHATAVATLALSILELVRKQHEANARSADGWEVLKVVGAATVGVILGSIFG